MSSRWFGKVVNCYETHLLYSISSEPQLARHSVPTPHSNAGKLPKWFLLIIMIIISFFLENHLCGIIVEALTWANFWLIRRLLSDTWRVTLLVALHLLFHYLPLLKMSSFYEIFCIVSYFIIFCMCLLHELSMMAVGHYSIFCILTMFGSLECWLTIYSIFVIWPHPTFSLKVTKEVTNCFSVYQRWHDQWRKGVRRPCVAIAKYTSLTAP